MPRPPLEFDQTDPLPLDVDQLRIYDMLPGTRVSCKKSKRGPNLICVVTDIDLKDGYVILCNVETGDTYRVPGSNPVYFVEIHDKHYLWIPNLIK